MRPYLQHLQLSSKQEARVRVALIVLPTLFAATRRHRPSPGRRVEFEAATLILKGGGDARTCAAVPRLLLPQSLNREMHAIFEGLSLDRPCTRPNGDRNKLPVSKEGTSKARQVLPVCVPAALLLFVQRTATVLRAAPGPSKALAIRLWPYGNCEHVLFLSGG